MRVGPLKTCARAKAGLDRPFSSAPLLANSGFPAERSADVEPADASVVANPIVGLAGMRMTKAIVESDADRKKACPGSSV